MLWVSWALFWAIEDPIFLGDIPENYRIYIYVLYIYIHSRSWTVTWFWVQSKLCGRSGPVFFVCCFAFVNLDIPESVRVSVFSHIWRYLEVRVVETCWHTPVPISSTEWEKPHIPPYQVYFLGKHKVAKWVWAVHFVQTGWALHFIRFQCLGSWKTFKNQKPFCTTGSCPTEGIMLKPNLIL